MVLLFLLLLVVQSFAPRKAVEDPQPGPAPPMLQICKSIDTMLLQQKFKASKNAGIRINMYPVKTGEGNAASDFDLVWYFTDMKGKSLDGPLVDLNKFKADSRRYVQYLKSINIPKAEVPFGYQLTLDNILMHYCREVHVCFTPQNQRMVYVNSCCKYCVEEPQSIQPDSVVCCKCPPACGDESEYRRAEVRKIITTEYK